MASIKGFIAPDRKLTPAVEGFSAFETMGRRVGALYNEAGQDFEKIGRLQAQSILDKKWPFDILALENSRQPAEGGGVRFRVARSVGSMEDPLGFYNDRGYNVYNVHDQISEGAAWLGSAGGELVDIGSGTTTYGNTTKVETFDPTRLKSVEQPFSVPMDKNGNPIGGQGAGIPGYGPGDVTVETPQGEQMRQPAAPNILPGYGLQPTVSSPDFQAYPQGNAYGAPHDPYSDENPNGPSFGSRLGSWFNDTFGSAGMGSLGSGVSDYGIPGGSGGSGY